MRNIDAQKHMKARFRWMNGAVILFGIAMLFFIGVRYVLRVSPVTVPDIVRTLILVFEVIFIVYFVAAVLIKITAKKVVNLLSYNALYENKLLMTKLYSLGIYFIGLFFVLGYLGVTLENLALIAGFMATGIALALRDVILSYLVWFVLLVKRPFRIGDYIQIGDDKGFVQHIGTFFVLLDDTPNERNDYVKVPNKIFWEKSMNNFGKQRFHERVSIKLDLDYQQLSKFDLVKVRKKLEGFDIAIERLYLHTTDEKFLLKLEYYVNILDRFEMKNQVLQSIFSILPRKKKVKAE